MFDGVPHDQLHQFIASSRATSSLPLVNPLSSFPLHHHHHQHATSHSPQAITTTTFTTTSSISFDSYSHHHHQLLLPLQHQQQQQHFLHPILHHKNVVVDIDEEKEEEEVREANNNNNTAGLVSDVDLEIERERSIMAEPGVIDDAWSNDEVLALLRIRSNMENWFPDFTWEHVSRKLAELGFKIRRAEKCKEKFEEENGYFNNINNCTKNFRPFLSELEVLYNNHTNQQNPSQNHDNNGTTIGAQLKNQSPVEIISPSELAGDQDERGSEDHHHQLESRKINAHEEIFGAKECSDQKEGEKVLETTRTTRDNKHINKKRKRSSPSSSSSHHGHHEKTKFEIFKGFCEDIVNKMMAQQEEMHNKLLEDMVKRDQEKVKKEEAWKKLETDRMNKELEIMAREQAVAGDRQATIIEFLRKFTSASCTSGNSSSSSDHHSQLSGPRNGNDGSRPKVLVNSTTSPIINSNKSSLIQLLPHDQSPNGASNHEKVTSPSSALMVVRHDQNPSGKTLVSTSRDQNPSSVSAQKKVVLQNPSPLSDQDLGKRWPRDEVLALINLRCSLYNSGDQQQQQQQQEQRSDQGAAVLAAKAVPLWERISQGMSEMGYKRSAKRCKEKWENINKYFRKTKDNVNKKRSVDSRTCPYFQHLSTLYSKGTLDVSTVVSSTTTSEGLGHIHHHDQDIYQIIADDHDHDHDHHVHVGDQGERSDHTNNVVPAAFDFEF